MTVCFYAKSLFLCKPPLFFTSWEKGLQKRLNNKVTKNYQDRLNYELGVIHKMGYDDYFLIVWDFILYDKTQINIEDIHFEIVSGDFAGRIENKYLIFHKDYEGQPIKLKCYVNNSQVSVEAQIFVRYVSDMG